MCACPPAVLAPNAHRCPDDFPMVRRRRRSGRTDGRTADGGRLSLVLRLSASVQRNVPTNVLFCFLFRLLYAQLLSTASTYKYASKARSTLHTHTPAYALYTCAIACVWVSSTRQTCQLAVRLSVPESRSSPGGPQTRRRYEVGRVARVTQTGAARPSRVTPRVDIRAR